MKTLRVDESFKQNALKQFEEMLKAYKPTDGAINFKIDPAAENKTNKMSVLMTSGAYLKMMTLIQECSIELAWHGTVERKDDYTMVITDILCYPQEATSATVDAKEAEYFDWLMKLDDEVVNKMRFQGHSHVNMSVSPSGRDTDNWQKLFQMCQKPDDFYIVCIANKTGANTWRVYDNKTGYLYEEKDIEFKVIVDGGISIKEWGKETIKNFVTEHKYTNSAWDRDKLLNYNTVDTIVANSSFRQRSQSSRTLFEMREDAEEEFDLFQNFVAGSVWNNELQCFIKPKQNKNKSKGKGKSKGKVGKQGGLK